jgi:hypothetical protein
MKNLETSTTRRRTGRIVGNLLYLTDRRIPLGNIEFYQLETDQLEVTLHSGARVCHREVVNDTTENQDVLHDVLADLDAYFQKTP